MLSFQYKKYSTSWKAFLADELIYYLLIVHKFNLYFIEYRPSYSHFQKENAHAWQRSYLATQLYGHAVKWLSSQLAT